MTRRRMLPDYVTAFTDRHGKERLRYRRKGYAGGYFKAKIGTEEFRQELRAFEDGKVCTIERAIKRTVPGSIDDLVARYFAVPTRLGPTLQTQRKVRGIIGKFQEKHGPKPVAKITFEHIDAIIAKKREKVMGDKRMEGGIEAARKLRKELMRLFAFAIKIRMRTDNPVEQADRIKVAAGETSTGYHTWTELEIDQYRHYHALGTKARLAMELMLWTGQRRGDAIRMGRQHIQGGYMSVRQGKGGKELEIPVAPQLLEAIVAMPPSESHLCFLVTEYGKPFSSAGFGNWFRDQCDAAGLPQCTSHGLRKAIMRRMAELGMGNSALKSVSGHSRDDEVATYTRAADQRHMADDAMLRLGNWESNRQPSEMSNRKETP